MSDAFFEERVRKYGAFFPVSLNPQEDVPFMRCDVPGQVPLFETIRSIANVMRDKRDAMLRGQAEDDEDVNTFGKLPEHPNVYSIIDDENIQNPKEYSRWLNKGIAAITNGRVSVGYRCGLIVLIDTQIQDGPLLIGCRPYPLLQSYAKEGGPERKRGFPNSILIQIAQTGLRGLPADDLEREYSYGELKTLGSLTNKFMGRIGYPWLTINRIAGRLYFF